MLELTGALELVVPFMLAALTAKAVGNYFTAEGIYDRHMELKGYLFLHDFDFAQQTGEEDMATAEDVVVMMNKKQARWSRRSYNNTMRNMHDTSSHMATSIKYK